MSNGQRLLIVLALAVSAPAAAQLPSEWFTNPGLTAADTQRLLYDELVKRGVTPEIAALVTIDTQVVRDEPDHVQIVQTMIGGLRREVDLSFVPGTPKERARVPLTLEDGSIGLAENVTTRRIAGGVATSGVLYLPEEQPSAALLERWQHERRSPWWLDVFGIRDAHAQAGVAGLAVSYADSFVSTAGNAVGVQGLTVDGVVDVASRVSADPGVRDVRLVGDVATDITNAMQTATEGPRTQWQSRLDTAGNVVKVLKTGYDVHRTVDKFEARDAKLKALEDCANNPTNPLAIRAQRDDPNYGRATTEAIADARLNLQVNSALSIIATTTNAAAGVLLRATSAQGSTLAKGVSYLNKAERALLDHVADEYIMKDAGKGVVPCEPDCGPVYVPTTSAPTEAEANYTPAEWSGTSSPEGLVCEAAPMSSSSAPSSTPAPTPPPSSAVCRVLRGATFVYHYSRQSSACGPYSCESTVEDAHFTGMVNLDADEDGYTGEGTGQYADSTSYNVTSPLRCASVASSGTTNGSVDLTVNVFASIDNAVTGGIDTSAMPPNTSVAEILFEGGGLHQETYAKNGCDAAVADSDDDGATNVGCYFYNVDLHRAGFYSVHIDNDPTGGVCTLQLQ